MPDRANGSLEVMATVDLKAELFKPSEGDGARVTVFLPSGAVFFRGTITADTLAREFPNN